ncbi:MAG: 50S ribosomal protein L22 [Candidatus Helarchaeota archaeon]|nr:50S ribosomal protein L22 [Candidatus Helarchaeota archaeon]
MCPNFGYSISGLDPDKTAIASGRDLRCSPKHAQEICNTIKGMMIEKAKNLLEQASLLKQPIPFKKHNKHVPHRKGLDQFKWDAGRYVPKAVKSIMKVLANAENNAEFKGLDLDRVRIVHASIHRGRKVKKFIPRAFGRSTPYYNLLTHVEIVLEEE